jgi:hypothetical protein
MVEDAKKIAEKNDKIRCTYSSVDVTDATAVAALV